MCLIGKSSIICKTACLSTALPLIIDYFLSNTFSDLLPEFLYMVSSEFLQPGAHGPESEPVWGAGWGGTGPRNL